MVIVNGIVRLFFVIIDDEPPRQSRRVRKEQPEYGALGPSPRKNKQETAAYGSSPKRSHLSTTCGNCGELEPDHTTGDCPHPLLDNEGYLIAIGSDIFKYYRKQVTGEEVLFPDRCAVCAQPKAEHDQESCFQRAVFTAFWGGGFEIALPSQEIEWREQCPYCQESHMEKTSKQCYDEQMALMQQFAGHTLLIGDYVRDLPICNHCGSIVPDHGSGDCQAPLLTNWGMAVGLALHNGDLQRYIERI